MTTKMSLNHQIKVGAFVCIGLVVVCISIFMVGGDSAFKKSTFIFAKFDSVQGLNEGSVVSFAGIKIGNIKEFKFSEEKKLVVVMKVDSEYLERIPEDSTIEVKTAGALGDKFLYISPGQSVDALKDGGYVQTLKASDLMSVLSEKGGEARKVFDILKETETLLVSLNRENRIEKILNNLSQSSADFRIAAADSRSMISSMKDQNSSQKISSSIERIDRILTKIDRGEGTLGALVNDSSLHESLKSLVGSSERRKSTKSLIRSSIEK